MEKRRHQACRGSHSGMEACLGQEAQHLAVGAGSQGAAEGPAPLERADARAFGAAAPALARRRHASEGPAPPAFLPAVGPMAAPKSPDRALQQQRSFQGDDPKPHTVGARALGPLQLAAGERPPPCQIQHVTLNIRVEKSDKHTCIMMCWRTRHARRRQGPLLIPGIVVRPWRRGPQCGRQAHGWHGWWIVTCWRVNCRRARRSSMCPCNQ